MHQSRGVRLPARSRVKGSTWPSLSHMAWTPLPGSWLPRSSKKGVLTRAWIVLLVGVPIVCGAIAATDTCRQPAALVDSGVCGPRGRSRGCSLAEEKWSNGDETANTSDLTGAAERTGSTAPEKLSSLSETRRRTRLLRYGSRIGAPGLRIIGELVAWFGVAACSMQKTSRASRPLTAETNSIAGIVRASAAFPGIPPRRTPMLHDPRFPVGPRVAFLADGGLWNNLGTQVLARGRLSRQWRVGGRHPPPLLFCGWVRNPPPVLQRLCTAEAQGTPSLNRVPGIALAMSLFRVAGILSANTVTPRVEAMLKESRRRVVDRERPTYFSPADLVADLRPVEQVKDDYRDLTWCEKDIR